METETQELLNGVIWLRQPIVGLEALEADRKLAGKPLERERQYRGLAERINSVFFTFDKALKYTYWNKASEELTGISSEDALGKHLYDLFPDTEMTRGAEKVYREVLATKQPQYFITRYSLGGKDFFFEINVYPLGDGLAVFVKDVTERRRAEETRHELPEGYLRLIEQSPVGIGLASLDGRVISANQAMQTITGYSLQELKRINLVATYIRPEDRKALVKKMNRDGAVFNYPVRLKRKNGASYDALLNISRVRFNGEDVFQTVCIPANEPGSAVENHEPGLSPVLPRPLTPLQERFVRSGLEGFSDREAFKLLISFCPCGGDGQKGKKCIKAFRNIRELLSASPHELKEAGLDAVCIFYTKFLREISAQVLREKIVDRPVFTSSKEIFDYLYYSMRDLKNEVFKVIYLNNRDEIIDVADLFEGETGRLYVRPRKVIEDAIEHKAAALIFVHNHPSGDPSPSRIDKRQTRDFVFVGKILQLRVLDHIIIGENRYSSFADAGLIQQYEEDFLKIKIRRM